MSRRLLKSIAFAVVALSMTATSCDTLPTDVRTPQETSAVVAATETQVSAPAEVVASGVSLSNYFFVLQPEPTTTTTSTSSGGLLGGLLRTVTTLVSNTLDLVLNLTKLIGIKGGLLEVLDHTLTVPKGAVTQPTLFTMRVAPTTRVEVELKAELETKDGLIDVGSQGFLKPVELELSYAHATNVRYPSRLKIALLNDDGTIKEILPSTVDTKQKTVTAKLPHFSRYVLVCD
ncbi:MAG TPA: hypothetical protein VF035_01745 [Longimicrobiales bacterium]